MPTSRSQLAGYEARLPGGAPIRIAQADTGTTSDAAVGRVGTESKAEAKHAPGEIPEPSLLFANSVLVALGLVLFAVVARRNLMKVPKGVGNVGEFMVESLNAFTIGIIGPGGEKYTPVVGTVFLYILAMNLIGLIPGLHSPTSNLTFTFALGLVVFLYAQYEGIRQNGPLGYIKHFAGPMWQLSPLMFPVELISEIVKPFTLAIRLFGNIFGEDVILAVLAGLLTTMGARYLGWIPVQVPVFFLALITAVVQAMVFASLTCIYLALMSHHGSEDEHGEADAHGTSRPTEAMARAHETSP